MKWKVKGSARWPILQMAGGVAPQRTPLWMEHGPVLCQAAQDFCKVRNPLKAEIPSDLHPQLYHLPIGLRVF